MITVPVVQAMFLGLLRLAAMGVAFYFYKGAHGDGTSLILAGGIRLLRHDRAGD